MDGKRLEEDTLRGTSAFLVAYCGLCLLSMIFIALDEFSLETTVTAVIACINNIGPGLDMVGPTGNYSRFSVLSKLILSMDMLFGRLEIFPMLLLFYPRAWKKRV
jgi:trk system potassium uptake protein TrkH